MGQAIIRFREDKDIYTGTASEAAHGVTSALSDAAHSATQGVSAAADGRLANGPALAAAAE